jgi:hypothetical protein
MTTFRTHFTYRVDTWTPDGESVVEHGAGVEDYQVALATFLAACQRWPGIPITLRRGRGCLRTADGCAWCSPSVDGHERAIEEDNEASDPYGRRIGDDLGASGL